MSRYDFAGLADNPTATVRVSVRSSLDLGLNIPPDHARAGHRLPLCGLMRPDLRDQHRSKFLTSLNAIFGYDPELYVCE